MSHSGRRPPRKATRLIKTRFKAVQSFLSLYEALIYCFFCLKRQKRKREKKYPSWRRGGAVNSGVNLRGVSHSCAVRRSRSGNREQQFVFFFLFIFVSDRQASDCGKKITTNWFSSSRERRNTRSIWSENQALLPSVFTRCSFLAAAGFRPAGFQPAGGVGGGSGVFRRTWFIGRIQE